MKQMRLDGPPSPPFFTPFPPPSAPLFLGHPLTFMSIKTNHALRKGSHISHFRETLDGLPQGCMYFKPYSISKNLVEREEVSPTDQGGRRLRKPHSGSSRTPFSHRLEAGGE